jgi:DNA replication protein DnaC
VLELSCDVCGGVGFEILTQDGREFARPCVCRRAAGGDAEGVAAACRLPPRYAHCTFATFETGNASLEEARDTAMRYCSRHPFSETDEGLGLLLTGENGVGKTHLAVAVLCELVTTKGARAQFWDFNELIREIKNSYNPETRMTEEQVLEPVITTDVLLLDDLGAWKMTDWMVDTLFYILNSRYLAKRVTLITTNFDDADRQTVLKADQLVRKEFLVERIGQRLRSRLMEMCLVVRMKGHDFRETRQSGKRFAVLGRPDDGQERDATPRDPKKQSGR